MLHVGTQSLVFRANIIRPDDTPLDAVLKLDPTGERNEAFVKEAEAYQGIGKDLQGDILPVFYGCFQTRIGATTVTCVALEYCGEPMQESLYKIRNPFRGELLLCVLAMHHKGMSHGDLYERNILVYHGHPVLIDLESSQVHKCGLRMKTVPGAMRPTVEEYGCPELHDLVSRMGIWKPDTLHFLARDIDKSSIHSVDDIKYFIPKYFDDEDRQRWEGKADALYKELYAERLLTYGTDKISRMPPSPRVYLSVD
ncbi:hypothetical protein B0H11DRAFT_1854645 [Mycena galericulata]|nr:hypothetical protein B0H11DRAFT_1854645 [Mycena galericulata]